MSSFANGDGAALPVCPPLARKPPMVEMPPNQFEPVVEFGLEYRRLTGHDFDLVEAMKALANKRLVLCPERRREPR